MVKSGLIEDVKAKVAAMFLYFSDILEKGVRDADGKFVGILWDAPLKFTEIYPKVDGLIIRNGFFKRLYASVTWPNISAVENTIVLKIRLEELEFSPTAKEYDFLLRRDVLDQQVVDTYNHKVRRVNDVHLLKVDNDLMVAHVDIGLRGLIRRLGWEKAVDIIIGLINKKARYLKSEDLVSWKYVQPVAINSASMTVKLSLSEKQLAGIPPADLSEIIFDLNQAQRMAIFRTLDAKTKAKVFENLEFDDQKAILKELDKKELAQIVSFMSSDEATDLLERLPDNTVKNLLTLIETGRAKKLSALLGYSGDSAGGLMTTDFVSLQDTMSIEAALEYIKTQTREFEVVSYIYIVDDKSHLKGVTTVRRLLFDDPKEPVLKTAFPKTVYVYLNNSVKEVAYLMDKYKVSSIPVIDENKVLHGVIAMDDVLSQVISIAWRKRPRAAKGI